MSVSITTTPTTAKSISFTTIARHYLIPDPANRKERLAHIRDLRRNWRGDRCGILLVWYESFTKRFYVIDGQHRLAAAPPHVAEFRCEVLLGYSKQEAYELREERERRKRRTNTTDRFQFALSAGDTETYELKNFVEHELGMEIGGNISGSNPNIIYAVGFVQTLWRVDKLATMIALSAARTAFPDKALLLGAIHGLFHVQRFAAPDNFISNPKWTPRIQRIGMREMHDRFNARSLNLKNAVYYYAVDRLLNDPKFPDRLNKGLRATAFTLIPLPPEGKL